MHRTFILSFVFLLIIPVISHADMGLQDVQAVCKIELKNGKTIEGVMLVARGGYNRHHDTNGFYVVINNETVKVVLFNTDFYAIQPYKGIVENSPTKKSGWGLTWKRQGELENTKTYYLKDISSLHYPSFDQTEIKETTDTVKIDPTDSLILLKRDIVHHIACELLDYVPIFPEVPPELFLDAVGSNMELRIATKEIERFELVWEPSQKWLDQISNVTQTWIETHRDKVEALIPPVWFHEMMKEKDNYKDSFKHWEF